MERDKDETIKNLQKTINKLTREKESLKKDKEELVKHCHNRERRVRASCSKQMADKSKVDYNKFLQVHLLVNECNVKHH